MSEGFPLNKVFVKNSKSDHGNHEDDDRRKPKETPQQNVKNITLVRVWKEMPYRVASSTSSGSTV